MAKSIYANQIAPKAVLKTELFSKDFKDPETEKFNQRITPTHRYTSTAERLAKSSHFYVNYSDKKLAEAFKRDPDLTTVDYYFPYAEGGPLMLDQVFSNYDYERLENKHKAMIENGFRHVVFEDQEDFFEILQRLETIDKTLKKKADKK